MDVHNSKVKSSKELRERKKNKLYSKILSQMEFYFSDSNLAKDRFVQNLIDNSEDGYIDLDVFTTFNKIKNLSQDLKVIADAVSMSKIIEISPDKKQIRRCTPIQTSKDFDACTLYVEKLPSHADIKWGHDVFDRFGTVDYISIPRFRISNKIKGFAFVEFHDAASVNKACEFYGRNIKIESSENEEEESGEENLECKSPISQLSKKRKNEDPSETEERLPKKAKTSTDKDSTEKTDSQEDNIKSENVTKKSKRKKKHHEKEVLPLRVMPKSEWKAYRNKYLDLQRTTMSHIKKWVLLETATMKATMKTDKPLEHSKKADFQLGVILKIILGESLQDTVAVKDSIKGVANVAYIDASVGETEIFVRCHCAEDAEAICRENKFGKLGSTEILKGVEEENYWAKIENDRKIKYDTPTVRKRRGRDKLISKATKLAEQKNKHIFFEE